MLQSHFQNSPLASSQNRLLGSLPADVLASLTAHLRAVDLPQGTTVFEAGQAIERAYFLHSGAVSLVVELQGGEMIEAAMVGRDSVLGASAALGARIALNKALVQIAGTASAIDVDVLRQLTSESEDLRALLTRHEQIVLAQAQQSAACNVTHPVEARLARWLLRTRDAAGSDMLPVTQEFLAAMLGVRRTSVSVAAHMLQEAGLIQYRRGHIQFRDVEGLRRAACECYAMIKAQQDRLLADGEVPLRQSSSGSWGLTPLGADPTPGRSGPPDTVAF